MEISAYQKLVRVTPRKLRLIADTVRDVDPKKALTMLKFMHKGAAGLLYKVMKQAVANATDQKLVDSSLKTKHIMIEEGPRYKRFRAGARGRARMIVKRTSHIKVILEGSQKEAIKQ